MEKAGYLARKPNYNSYGRVRPLHIGHPLAHPQSELTSFLKKVDKRLTQRKNFPHFWLRPLVDAHFTVMQKGLAQAQMEFTDGSKSELDFLSELTEAISVNLNNGLTLEVNPEKPLKVLGYRDDKLALNLLSNESFEAERDIAEEIVLKFFRKTSGLRQLNPHVVIGRLIKGSFPMSAEKSHWLIPGLLIPAEIELDPSLLLTVNGRQLEKIYADRIARPVGEIALSQVVTG